MTTYSITGPDGKTYSIDGPPGATQQEVVAKIQERIAAQKATPPSQKEGEPVSDSIREKFGLNSPLNKFLQSADAGVVRSVGGAIQAAADGLNAIGIKNNIGQLVGQKTDRMADAISPPKDRNSLGESVGTAVPYLLGGEFGTAAKGTSFLTRLASRGAMGAVYGAGQEEKGSTPEERNANRVSDAKTGALVNAALGVPADVAGRLGAQIINSHSLNRAFSGILQTIGDWKPDASEVAKNVATRFNALNDQYQIRMKRFDSLVGSLGGVPMDKVAEPVKAARKLLPTITDNDPAKLMLSKVVNALDTFSPKEGKDFDKVMEQFGGKLPPPKVIAQLEKAGAQINPIIKSAPGGVVGQLSENIDSFLKKQKGDVQSEGTIALTDIKKQLDSSLGDILDQHPAAARVWNGIKSQFIDPTEPLKSGSLVNLLSNDPEKQIESVLGTVKHGDDKSARMLSSMLSPGAKQNVVKTVMHDAVTDSFDPSSAHIDASKFQKYFGDPNVKANLKHFMSPQEQETFQGVQNFIRADAHAKPGKGFFGAHAGSWATSIGIFDAIKKTMGGLAVGHLNVMPIAEALGAAAGVRVLTHGVDVLQNSILGKNFFNAASKIEPGTPKWDALINQWYPRLTRVLGLAFSQDYMSGQAAARQKQTIPYPKGN